MANDLAKSLYLEDDSADYTTLLLVAAARAECADFKGAIEACEMAMVDGRDNEAFSSKCKRYMQSFKRNEGYRFQEADIGKLHFPTKPHIKLSGE